MVNLANLPCSSISSFAIYPPPHRRPYLTPTTRPPLLLPAPPPASRRPRPGPGRTRRRKPGEEVPPEQGESREKLFPRLPNPAASVPSIFPIFDALLGSFRCPSSEGLVYRKFPRLQKWPGRLERGLAHFKRIYVMMFLYHNSKVCRGHECSLYAAGMWDSKKKNGV